MNHVYLYMMNTRAIYDEIISLAHKYESREVTLTLWRDLKDSDEMGAIIRKARSECRRYKEPYPLRDQAEARDLAARHICLDLIVYWQEARDREAAATNE